MSQRIVDFVDRMLQALVEHPRLLGPLPCAELQVLRLLEVRLVATSGSTRVGSVTQAFQAFLSEELPGSTASLHTRVAGNPDEFCRRLAEFVSRAKPLDNKDQPMTQDNPSPHRAPWMRDFGSTFTKKTYGRIWVRNPEDVGRVVAIIGEIDEFEASYLPDDFVAVLDNPEDARLVYGHKFELRTDLLEYACWKAGIEVWIVTGASEA